MTETTDDFDDEHRTVFHRMSLDSMPKRRRNQPPEYELQQQQQRQLPSYSQSLLSRRTITKTIPLPVRNALDGATSSSIAILFTLLLMALIHYRAHLWQRMQYYRQRPRGINFWGIFQRLMALLPSPIPEEVNHNNNAASRKITRNRHRTRQSIPDLEVIIPKTNESTSISYSSQWQETLEPAFEQSNLYPQGWLVYHPLLGVVTKIESDLYQVQIEENSINNNRIEPPQRDELQSCDISSICVTDEALSTAESSGVLSVGNTSKQRNKHNGNLNSGTILESHESNDEPLPQESLIHHASGTDLKRRQNALTAN